MLLDRSGVVVGLFQKSQQALEALGRLNVAGFAAERISVLMPYSAAGTAGHVRELSDWSQAVGPLTVPGVGQLLAVGEFRALDGTAGGEGVWGIVVGRALLNMGLSADEATYYEDEVRSGQTLVAIRCGHEHDGEAWHILEAFGARRLASEQA